MSALRRGASSPGWWATNRSGTVEGLALASAAEAIALRADASPSELAAVAHARASIFSAKGDQDAALREAERALALFDKSPDASELDKADVQNTIGLVRSAQGDYVRAEQMHRQVLERRRAALGDGHPKVADSLDNLGVVRYHQGAFDEARRFYEQALAMRVAALGPDNRDVGHLAQQPRWPAHGDRRCEGRRRSTSRPRSASTRCVRRPDGVEPAGSAARPFADRDARGPRGPPAYVERMWQRILEEVAQGRQAYVVCPRIEATDSPRRSGATRAGRPR